MTKMEKQIKQFLDFLQNEKRVSMNTLQSYSRDIHQYESYLSQNKINYVKVDNQASGKADLLFFYETLGTLYIRTTADSKWTKFTGTVVN